MCLFWTCWAWDGVCTCSCEMSCGIYVKIPMCQLFCWLLGYVGNYVFQTLLLHIILGCSWRKGRLCEFWEPEEKQPSLYSEGATGFSLFLLFPFLTLALPTISDPGLYWMLRGQLTEVAALKNQQPSVDFGVPPCSSICWLPQLSASSDLWPFFVSSTTFFRYLSSQFFPQLSTNFYHKFFLLYHLQ